MKPNTITLPIKGFANAQSLSAKIFSLFILLCLLLCGKSQAALFRWKRVRKDRLF